MRIIWETAVGNGGSFFTEDAQPWESVHSFEVLLL